jgi:cyclopropane fatty-acyl-phospholipid synthase-like methyltransferase
MSSTRALYDEWSAKYDAVDNPTRDLEKRACREILSSVEFKSVLELGSGAGKNTVWLAECAENVISVELSEQMQAIAKEKVRAANVEFRSGDIRGDWAFVPEKVDLITCSLILEHIEYLEPVFENAAATLNPTGGFYICELHPFKQYAGSKARFEMNGETKVLDCYQHHITDYTDAAFAAGFSLSRLDEWFDSDDRSQVPRLISFLFTLNG